MQHGCGVHGRRQLTSLCQIVVVAHGRAGYRIIRRWTSAQAAFLGPQVDRLAGDRRIVWAFQNA
jgi:hypothetical protein